MTARSKVAILHYQSYPEIRVTKFAETLAGVGMDVTVVARDVVDGTDPRGKHPYAAAAAGSTSIRTRAVAAPGSHGLRRALSTPYPVNPAWRAAMRRVLDEGAELVVVRDFHLAAAAASLAHRRGVPVVLDIAENYPALLAIWRRQEGRRRALVNGVVRNIALARRVERAGVRAADAVTVVVPEHVERIRGLGAREVVVVENTPVLSQLLDGVASGGAGSTSAAPLHVVYTGEIHLYRGIDTVIDAVALLADRGGPPLRVSLVGTGKLVDVLKARAVRRGVGEQVSFLGWQPDLRPFIAAADIGLIPPHASAHQDVTMPNKLYDFMAFGKPVVVSDARPMRRVVEQAGCGLVFPAGDPAGLADCLARLADPDLRRRTAAAGAAAVRDTYNWDRDGAVLLDIVRRLLRCTTAKVPAPTIDHTESEVGQ